MRYLRFAALVVALIAAYLAQYIFNFRSLNDFFPIWFLDTFPTLYNVTRWLPEDLMDLAMVLTIFAALVFGLVSAPWVGEYPKPVHRPDRSLHSGTTARSGMVLMVVALCIVVLIAARALSGDSSRVLDFVWLLGLALYLLGSVLIDSVLFRRRTLLVLQTNPQVARLARPYRGWPWLAVILAGAFCLFTWELGQLPARVEPAEVQSGLQALALARDEASGLFTPGLDAVPKIANWPAALSMGLTGRVLLAARLSSVLHGLLLVAATWLLSCELFRRIPREGPYIVVLEDDGRWLANWAAMLVALGHVTIHFSRIPVYLPPVAWGILGLWMLLRGLRTRSYPLLALSGLGIGLAGITYASGLLFWIVTPLWWLGLWLLRRNWIDPRYVGMGVTGALTWFGGLMAMVLPVWGAWLHTPGAFAQFMRSALVLAPEAESRLALLYQQGGFTAIFGENLRLILLALNANPDVGSMATYPAAFLHSFVAPLFFLALGVLLLNLDRLPGWLLLSYLGGSLVFYGANAVAPSWRLLLPLYPIAAICIAFALDRIRVTLLETAGTWLEQTSIYVIVGLILWVGVKDWTTYFEYGHLQANASAVTGRAIAEQGAPENSILLIAGAAPVHWADPVVEYVASGLRERATGPEYSLDNLPDTLPANAQLLIQPDSAAVLPLIQARYPEGAMQIERDLRGNIVLYVYRP